MATDNAKSFGTSAQKRLVMESKVIKMADLTKKSADKIEKIVNGLLNNGFKPIMVNNYMFVFVRAYQVQIPATNDVSEIPLPA